MAAVRISTRLPAPFRISPRETQRRHSYGRGDQRTIYRGRLPRTLPGYCTRGLTGVQSARLVRRPRGSQPARVGQVRVSARRPPTSPRERSSRGHRTTRILVAIYALGYTTFLTRSTSPTTRRTSCTTSCLAGPHRHVRPGVRLSPGDSLGTRSCRIDLRVLTLAACVLVAATVAFFLAAPLIIDL